MDFEVCTKAPESWARMTIDDVCTRITSGGTPSRRTPGFFINGSVPWVKTQELQDRWIRATEEQITEDAVNNSSAKLLPAKSVLLAMYGATVGQLGVLASPMACNQACCALIVNDEIADFRYVYYLLLQHRAVIKSLATGAAQQNLSAAQIKQFRFAFPDRQSQEQVADVLSALDDKIVLNRSINQTLEAMAQAIFKSWFVDFDPVKAKIAAKQEGRDPLRAAMTAISGKPDAELDTLPPEQYEQIAATAALFPDEMEESELGEIPKGWAFKSVADIAQFASGKVEVSSLTEEIYISTENMLENRAGVARASSLPSVATVPSFKAGQILVSNIRPYFKKIWMARFDGGRSPDVLAFEPTDFQSTEFAYNLMYQDAFFEFMTRTAKGAKMPRGDKDAIMSWTFPCPDELLMVAFSQRVRPHYAHIESLNSQNKSLSELRDSVLPKLLSGELSVAEAIGEVET